MWEMTCPICLTTLYKDAPEQPWVCHNCGWRSDEAGRLRQESRPLQLTDCFPLA